MINAFDDVKFEAASVLAELYEQQAQSNLSKPILRKAIELSQHSVYWHCRLIFQLAVSDPIFYFFLQSILHFVIIFYYYNLIIEKAALCILNNVLRT